MIATNQSSSFENESNNQNDIIDQSNHFELKEQQQIDNSSSSSSSNESGKISENSTTTSSSSINARYNCTPVDRNEVGWLVDSNHFLTFDDSNVLGNFPENKQKLIDFQF